MFFLESECAADRSICDEAATARFSLTHPSKKFFFFSSDVTWRK